MMALRAVNTCSLFRTASPPPLFALQYHFCHFKTLQYGRYIKFGFQSNIIRCDSFYCHGGSIRSCSVHSLVNSVMEELAAIRKRKRVCSAIKLTSSGELLNDKLVNRVLEKGMLLEFKKDSDRVLLAVAQRPDGKKNWMVYDQVLVETTNAAC